jgi:hypothetical protein
MPQGLTTDPAIAGAADRLAALLLGRGDPSVADSAGGTLAFDGDCTPRDLTRGAVPSDCWAVDGGSITVLDARCLAVVVWRAASVRYQGGACVQEDSGALHARVLGGDDSRRALSELGDWVAPDAAIDGLPNLLRDFAEWQAVARCIEAADPGGVVLVDGDLVPDWRIHGWVPAGILGRAKERNVLVAGVTKHSSLSRGGTPLLGQLELEAEAALGPRVMWWAPIAHTRPDLVADGTAGLQVVAARLDPDARFAFRIDLPADADPEAALGRLAALADDAGFPGYPYPLSVADRVAACPPWLRADVRHQLDDLLDRAGVPLEVRDRAFTDRHGLMERA